MLNQFAKHNSYIESIMIPNLGNPIYIYNIKLV